jgi:hypothetical protein
MPTFERFVEEFKKQLVSVARSKGYSDGGTEGRNILYEFINQAVGGPGHALGEIIYKATRYARRRDKVDLLKIAAWAYLVWKYDQAAQQPIPRIPRAAQQPIPRIPRAFLRD